MMEKRQTIYSGLQKHYGSMIRLAREQKKSKQWVRLVLTGEAEDEDLLLAASKLWRDLEEARINKLREAHRLAEEAEALSTVTV